MKEDNIFEGLERIYRVQEDLAKLNMQLTQQQLDLMAQLEESVIKEEILPALSENIEPLLSQIKRELVLVVEYHPGVPLSVALSRKVKIRDFTDAMPLTPINKPVTSGSPAPKPDTGDSKSVANTTKGMRVTFLDGTTICHTTAINTFIEVLRKIGLDRIPQVGIEHGGYNLVSKQKRTPKPGVIWQHEVDGWYVYSNTNNETKADDLKRISKYFGLGLTVEEGKPKTK